MTKDFNLDGVESGKLLGQLDEVVEALERGSRATGLQDQATLRHKQGALAQDVSVHLYSLYFVN